MWIYRRHSIFHLSTNSKCLFVSAQRITTIQLDGVQYFISRMNPYSPELNYFLAYQYCRYVRVVYTCKKSVTGHVSFVQAR